MEGTTEINSAFSKQEIQNMKFPTKLWLLTNTPNKVIKWSTEGSSVLIDFIALDDYLCSTTSIFKARSRSAFIRNLNIYGFQKSSSSHQNEELEKSDILYEYKHENFQQGRVELISKIEKLSGIRKQPVNLAEVQQKFIKHPNRQFDPCCSIIKALSDMERARLNLRVILQVQAENYILHKKLTECEQKSPSSSVSVIELPAEAFENPFESISRFEENSEYAGFYGHATTEQIKQFFDEYLPIYAQANGEDVVEKSICDNLSQNEDSYEMQNTTSSVTFMDTTNLSSKQPTSEDPASCPSNFQIKYSVSLDSNENKEYTLNILDESCSQIVSGMDNFGADKDGSAENPGINPVSTSTLEPIFTNCDEDNEINNKEEDISMDQYLKFKNSPQKSCDDLKEVSALIKTEKTEDDVVVDGGKPAPYDGNIENTEDNESNENNFKNFFNQYRESMNLLYD